MRLALTLAASALALYVIYRCYYMLHLDGKLDDRLREAPVILDVRTAGEWRGGHIEGSVNIALSKLHHGPIPIDKHQLIITCCSHGLRSVKAVNILRERGYSRVYNGGAWSDLQKRLVRTRPQ